MKNSYRELPEGYKEVFGIDVADKKTGLILNLIATVLTVLFAAVFILVGVFFGRDWKLTLTGSIWYVLGFFVLNVLYIVLHELTHGAVYKVMTGEKLTFGFKITYAFCGVPDVYVSRRTALFSLCAPLTLFSVLFLGGAIVSFFYNPYLYFLFGLMFAIHFGGCAGDMYVTWLFITKLKDRSILMRDIGAKQTFYQK